MSTVFTVTSPAVSLKLATFDCRHFYLGPFESVEASGEGIKVGGKKIMSYDRDGALSVCDRDAWLSLRDHGGWLRGESQFGINRLRFLGMEICRAKITTKERVS